jgi:hypothetical protein
MTLRLRINVIDSPAGVTLRMQRGRDGLVEPSTMTKSVVTFDFDVRVGSRAGSLPNFLGEFTQGPPAARFVYVNSGRMAGPHGTSWSRRAKIPLTGITQAQIEKAIETNGVLVADYEGTGRDGGPTCASVRLDGDGWRIERS